MRGLYAVAYHARLGEGTSAAETTVIDQPILEREMRNLGARGTEVFVKYCTEANGLLLAQGRRRLANRPADEAPVLCFSFPHPSIEEYLAARYIATLQNPHDEIVRLNSVSDRWFYVGVFLAEYVAIVSQQYWGLRALVESLIKDAAGEGRWRNVWLAGTVFPLFQREFPEHKDDIETLENRVRQPLANLYSAGHLAPRERAAAGCTLAVLGDPRDLDELVTIPDESFRMGCNEHEGEKPESDVTLDSYRIGKYPVTVAQWRRFVDSQNRDCDSDSLRGFENHPVVWVSWYDAMAYCRWLTQQWRRENKIGEREIVRLPTEAEWEHAARGTEPLEYPWGPEFEPTKANVDETGIGKTCAVGGFPAGASPSGVLDMAGNVWEWCHSLYKRYPYRLKDGREDSAASGRRVLRGGAFYFPHRSARCACRDFYDPDERYNFIGFRVVVSPLDFSDR